MRVAMGRHAAEMTFRLVTGLIVATTVLISAERLSAQAPPTALAERCKQLLRRDLSRLTDEELRTLRTCLEPLKQRQDEKRKSVDEILSPIQQKAPLRIYGK